MTTSSTPPRSGAGIRELIENRPATVKSLFLDGPAGRLEALLNEGSPTARFAALVCHPHPLGGGTLHNKVVYHAMKVFNDPAWGLEFPVLRFNFRGTGLSEGLYEGLAEAADVQAALVWLSNEFHLPIVAAGFSFGAAMTVAACCSQALVPSVKALVCLGLPLEAEGHAYSYPQLPHCPLPKLFLSGDSDSFAPASRLAQVIGQAANPKQLALIPGADHFFSGRIEPMQKALGGWLLEQLP
ncbi:MAG: alpha/beta hydrolase [Terracidiphilus sp.]|nr:alpha/beta hydrolase [Terracidiphilus sp.]